MLKAFALSTAILTLVVSGNVAAAAGPPVKQSETDALQLRVASLEGRTATLELANTSITQNLSALSSSVTSLQSSVAVLPGLQSSVSGLNLSVTNMNSSINTLAGQVANISTLQTGLASLNGSLSGLTLAVQTNQANISNLQQRVATIEAKPNGMVQTIVTDAKGSQLGALLQTGIPGSDWYVAYTDPGSGAPIALDPITGELAQFSNARSVYFVNDDCTGPAYIGFQGSIFATASGTKDRFFAVKSLATAPNDGTLVQSYLWGGVSGDVCTKDRRGTDGMIKVTEFTPGFTKLPVSAPLGFTKS